MDTGTGPTGGSGRVRVGDAEFEVTLTGDGEPVLVIPTAVNPYELRPLAESIAATGRYSVVQYRRRGSGTSSPPRVPGTIAGEAADAAALLRALGIARAHVLGASYSAAIALTLAATRPELVHTLTVHEPPPTISAAAGEFLVACRDLLTGRDRDGALATLRAFEDRLDGPAWREELEALAPGSVAVVEQEADLFFDHDLPTLMSWGFGDEDAGGIGCPLLWLGGTESGPWFAAVHATLSRWFPAATGVVLDGADHSLMLKRASEVAGILIDFLAEHPVP